MTTSDVATFVQEAISRSKGKEYVNLREIGTDPRGDARFLTHLFEAFPNETPDQGTRTIIASGRRWHVTFAEGYVRLVPATTGTQRKKSAEEYKKWWAAELALRGIEMRVPEQQIRKTAYGVPSEEAEE